MPRGRTPVVVDTNVAITANRREGGTYACANACAQKLMEIRDQGQLVLDQQGEILSEYKAYLNYSGTPGLGDAFFKWFFNNRGRSDLCYEVSITPIEHKWRRYREFPQDDALASFDKADQKFVAVSQSHPAKPQIIQARDHKWLGWERDLAVHGTSVLFLCKSELLATASRKAGGN